MSNTIAIFYFLKSEFQKDPDKWFRVSEVATEINLSVDRARKHLNLLVHSGDLETHIDGWRNVYRFKCGR